MNITHYRWDTLTRKLVFKDKDWVLIDITGHTITFTMKYKKEDDTTVIQKVADMTDPTNWEAEIVIDAGTIDIDPWVYVYDIQRQYDNIIKTIIQGTFSIIYDITT